MVAEILDNFDEIKEKIAKHTGWTDEEIEKKINKKQEEYGGFLTRAGAAFSIAKDAGVEIFTQTMTSNNRTKISELLDGMRSVRLKARVVRVFSTRVFEKQAARGEVTNVEIMDESGNTRLVVWGNRELVDKLRKGQVIEVINAYTRMNNNNVEVHAGNRTSIKIVEDDPSIPRTEVKIIKLAEVKPNDNGFDFYARVEKAYPVYEFQREKGMGKVANVMIRDGNASKKLVLWGDNAEKVKDLMTNDCILVENAYTKEDVNEVHVGWMGRVLKEENKGIPLINVAKKAIRELSAGEEAEITADVVDVFPPTVITICANCKTVMKEDVCEKCGGSEKAKSLIVNTIFDDGTSTIRGTLYRKNAEDFLGLKAEEYENQPELFDENKKELLGEEFVLFGQVKEVPEFNRKEFIVKTFAKLDPVAELEKMKVMS